MEEMSRLQGEKETTKEARVRQLTREGQEQEPRGGAELEA